MKYNFFKHLVACLLTLWMPFHSLKAMSQPKTISTAALPTESLFSVVDLYQQNQILSEDFKHRLTELQKKFLWNIDQVKYLKDFFHKISLENDDWTLSYCQIVSLFKTDFYVDYSDSLDVCSRWPRKQLDLVSFNRDIALFGFKFMPTQLQEAEIYDKDYVIRETTQNREVISVGPLQEFLARANFPPESELSIPLKQYQTDVQSEPLSEFTQGKNHLSTIMHTSFYERNKYLTWGLALVAGAFAYQYLQGHKITIQY